MPKHPLLLMILDGWGINPQRENNAIAQAKTPNMTRLCAEYPCTDIGTSGMSVGLPEGQMGNSEVGHLNMGSGRIVYQDLTRISKAIADGDFFTNPVLLDCICQDKGGRRTPASCRAPLRRRGPLPQYPPLCAPGAGPAGRAEGRLRPLPAGRPRHPSQKRRRLSCATRTGDCQDRGGKDCHRNRPLLRHGP